MKRKSLFTFGSVLVATALIGGTLAATAWAVTDNANPFGIRITPNSTLPDVGGNDIVTLEWGASKTLADVTGLAIGQEKAAGVVTVKATTGKSESFNGALTVTLTTPATGADRLIDYLTVDVYSGTAKPEVANPPTFLSVPYTESTTTYYTKTVDKEVTSGTEYSFAFYVSLKSSVNPTIYNAIKSQIVTVTVDWGKGSDVQEVTSSTIYYKNVNNWANVKLYAWNDGGKAAVEWPGVAMTLVDATSKIYSAELESGYSNVLFNNGLSGDDERKTGDLVYSTSKPYYDGDSWEDAPELTPVTEPDYYVVGDVMGWDTAAANKLTKGTYVIDVDPSEAEVLVTYTYKSTQYTFSSTNQALKVLSSTNVWYGHNGSTDDANFVMEGAGKYTFYFNPDFDLNAIHAQWEALE